MYIHLHMYTQTHTQIHTDTYIHTYIHNRFNDATLKQNFLHLDAAAHPNKSCEINKQIRPYANEAAALTFILDCV